MGQLSQAIMMATAGADHIRIARRLRMANSDLGELVMAMTVDINTVGPSTATVPFSEAPQQTRMQPLPPPQAMGSSHGTSEMPVDAQYLEMRWLKSSEGCWKVVPEPTRMAYLFYDLAFFTLPERGRIGLTVVSQPMATSGIGFTSSWWRLHSSCGRIWAVNDFT